MFRGLSSLTWLQIRRKMFLHIVNVIGKCIGKEESLEQRHLVTALGFAQGCVSIF